MEYLNKIIDFFNTEEITDDTLKIKRNDFETILIMADNKIITKFGNFKDYESLYKILVKKYNEHVTNKIIEKLKTVCSDCKITYRLGNIKIKYENSYINIDKDKNIRTFIDKKHFKKFLEIQNKLFETGIINA